MSRAIKNETLKGVSLLILAAFLYSLMPLLIRGLGGGGVPPVAQVFLRYIFAFISAAFYFLVMNKIELRFKRKDIFLIAVTTIGGYALTNLFFTYGILYTEVSTALFLFYGYAILVPVFGFFVLKERINRYNVTALVLSIIGLLLLFQPNSIPTWKVGGFFAILSALCQAVYLIGRKKLHDYSSGFMMIANTFVGCVVVGIISVLLESKFYFAGGITQLTPQIWLSTILFGLNNFLAWFAMTKGFLYFKATAGSLILLSELIFGIVFALAFFGEIPSLFTFVGGGLLLCAISLVILKGEN